MSEKLVKDLKSTNLQKPYGYIYKTTNLINGKIYIGQHASSNFNNKYKGSGTVLKRAFKKYSKEKFKCLPLCWCWTKDELNKQEIKWIKYYNSTNQNIGYNLTFGGEGLGKNFKYSIETCKKMSKIQLLKNKNSKNLQKALQKAHSKEIICLQTLERFKSITQAAECLNLTVPSISEHLRGNKKHVKGFVFNYYNSKNLYKQQALYTKQPKTKKIICLQTLDVFNSIKEASAKLEITPSSISAVLCKRQKFCKGYSFEYYVQTNNYTKQPFSKVYKTPQTSKSKKVSKPIICLQTLKVYDSSRQAALELDLDFKQISSVLREKIKHVKGYTFKFYKSDKKYTQQDFFQDQRLEQIKCLTNNKTYASLKEAASDLKLDPQQISLVLNKRSLTTKGYEFEKFNE